MEEIQAHLLNMFSGESEPEDKIPADIPDPTYANTVFKLPIDHLEEETYTLSPIVASDLELVLGENPVYQTLFDEKQEFAKQVLPMYKEKYTTNVKFLQDTQVVIENMKDFYETETYDMSCNCIQKQWTAVKHDPKFMETYGYLEWSMLEQFNHSSFVLQSLTLANMLSPLMSFFVPILFLLFPFIILKIQGVPIALSGYMTVLKEIAKHHFIGKALTTFESFSVQNFLYLLGTLALYGLQMYQNVIQCIRFYSNTQKINEDLCTWKKFVNHSRNQIKHFIEKNNTLSTYSEFCTKLKSHSIVLDEMYTILDPVCEFAPSITKSTEVGYMLKCYYELHTNPMYEKTILYCMGLEGYLRLMKGVSRQLSLGVVQKASYCVDEVIEDESGNILPECSITQQYFPSHGNDCIRNDVTLDTFGVITGPNASGKTTYLKTTAINIILCQQFGVGFFESCKMRPYTQIHSYLNIPDTSGRDSLFQAESRRCKEILEKIQSDSGRQFCIFDELFSGTNPKEATKSAYAFLEYLRQYHHVDLFLTTHYVSICDEWSENAPDKRAIENYQMIVEETETRNIPTYKIATGISRIEGAVGILQDMDYPEEMIAMVKNQTSPSSGDEESQDENDNTSVNV
jgi:hypothetical protein